MPTRHRPTLILSAALLACGGDTEPTRDIQVHITDSAGVRIVDYAGVPEVDPPFAIAEDPIYRHGANPGDYIFQSVDAGRLFPDGSAVVADWYGEVVVLSPDGTKHEVLARRWRGTGRGHRPLRVCSSWAGTASSCPTSRQSRLTLFVGDSVARNREPPSGTALRRGGVSVHRVSCCSGTDTPTVPGST